MELFVLILFVIAVATLVHFVSKPPSNKHKPDKGNITISTPSPKEVCYSTGTLFTLDEIINGEQQTSNSSQVKTSKPDIDHFDEDAYCDEFEFFE